MRPKRPAGPGGASGQAPSRGRGPVGRTYSAKARRAGRTPADRGTRSRFVIGRIVLAVVLVATGLKLGYVQGFQAEALSARAEQQRTTTIDIPAQRGSIVDRNGAKLAFSVETRTLWANLRLMRKNWAEAEKKNPDSKESYDTRVAEIAKFIAQKVPDKATESELLEEFHDKDSSFTYLVDDVKPSVADEIQEKYPEIGYEKRARREYPSGKVGSNIVGFANWRMEEPDQSKHNIEGLAGLESARNSVLTGEPGRQVVDTAQGTDVVIPGTEREVQPAIPGSDLELTLDSDVQYNLQRMLSDYVAKSRADGGSAVVLDSKTGEIYGLTSEKTLDPNNLDPDLMTEKAVTQPFEPGSVNKVITAAGAIENGITGPRDVHRVPGSMKVADHTVRDAWDHGTQPFTTTGIFAKSSNVGTLMLAQELGPDRYLDLLKKFGLGRRTGAGLPGESPGYVPPRNQWSGTTFGNLPIGQGLSMTVLQMAGMYQAIANDGVRVEPRVVAATRTPDGRRVAEPEPDRTRVVSAKTARTVRNMLRATTQDGDLYESGTAPQAAIEGYQISGKTGTGQQVDPETGAYSNELYNITFAGILPADDPRFVVGIRLDAPDTTLPAGSSAAPLFKQISSYLAQRYQIPLSDKEAPVVPLIRRQ
ncbi:peptidoglycan D,D-transpeptidase FtsI family protein [Prauserella alba]|uniref:Penicillin-binding protein 2 n=1 Tax=Prauserella alba TaxID=176898 RepID=A0ABN1VV46_9PSEU|nr:penicillin-binding protein 2 [Prauserella alba]MCP2179850.1 cell division protein FtsI (penicillin-binding protein 3) [Prauserella alba]